MSLCASRRCRDLEPDRAPTRSLLYGRLRAPSLFERHANAAGRPADLATHSCLTRGERVILLPDAWHLTAADGTALNISPEGNLRTNSGAVLKVAALAGHGLVCLPTYFVGDALPVGRLGDGARTITSRRPLRCEPSIRTTDICRPKSALSLTFSSRSSGKSRHGTIGPNPRRRPAVEAVTRHSPPGPRSGKRI